MPAARYELHCQSHADLLQVVQPGTADAVMFNFGWLPGADHGVFSTAQSSIPALNGRQMVSYMGASILLSEKTLSDLM